MMEVAVVYINKLGSMFYNCSICSKNIESLKLDIIESHIQDHYQHFPLSCHVCSEQFFSLGCLIDHSNVHSRTKHNLISVGPPQTLSTQSDTVLPDINLNVGKEQIADEEDERFEPFAAGKSQEDSNCSLYDNLLILSSENEAAESEMGPPENNKRKYVKGKVRTNKKDPIRRYPCKVCEKLFASKDNVNKHMRCHTGEKPYQCSLCDKRFRHSSYINIHMRSHTGEKPYMCTMCGLTFTIKWQLADHMHIHSNTLDFKCSQCDKSFARKRNLQKHIRSVHSGLRPHSCDICEKKFRVKDALRQHLKLHSDDKEYKCKICDDAFSQPAGLHSHMKTRHRTLAMGSARAKTKIQY